MAAKLSDREFAERVRASNRRRTDRRRERLKLAGYQQLLVWLPTALRSEIDRMAAEQGATVSDTATVIIRAGIAAMEPQPVADTPAPESLPLFEPTPTESERTVKRPRPSPVDAKARDERILALHQQGRSGHAIARQVGCSEKTVRTVLKRAKGDND